MKRSVFKSDGLYIEYAYHREGPPHQFICCYRNTAWLIFEHTKVLKQFKLGKGTPTRDALTEWLQSLELSDPVSNKPAPPESDKPAGVAQGLA